MPRKKKTYGPSLEGGIEYAVIPATKKALLNLRESFSGNPKLIEKMTMISPVDFIGEKRGREFIEERASSWENTYVPYVIIRDLSALKTPKADALRKKLADEEGSLKEALKKIDVSGFKAKLVTCPECESKVNKNYVKECICPVCAADLRSKSSVQMIERKQAKIKRARMALDTELAKTSSKAPLRYLVAMPKEDKDGK